MLNAGDAALCGLVISMPVIAGFAGLSRGDRITGFDVGYIGAMLGVVAIFRHASYSPIWLLVCGATVFVILAIGSVGLPGAFSQSVFDAFVEVEDEAEGEFNNAAKKQGHAMPCLEKSPPVVD